VIPGALIFIRKKSRGACRSAAISSYSRPRHRPLCLAAHIQYVAIHHVGFHIEEKRMARKYSEAASHKVERAMHERKRGTLKSGRSGRRVTSRKQAIAIGLSEARRAGKKVPKKRSRR
jgi:hypothetical protein